MKRKLEISELIFKVFSYTFLTVFALLCLYPFLYAVSASLSGRHAVEYQELILFPKDIQFEAFAAMFSNKINELDNGESLTTYTVNDNGYINFPHIDTIMVEGMTCSELEQFISKKIADEGLATGATVSAKITNFKVTVIGESATGVYEFDDEIVTIFDLVAKANLAQGNSSNYGGIGIRRDKILVMREVNGVMQSQFVSLLSKDIFYSPYYYLQQNDIVYVWPSKTTIRGSNRLADYWLSRLSIITSALSIVTVIIALWPKEN